MDAPAAIRATFADYRRVRGRKVGQLVFEVPLEQLHDAIASLGGEPSVEQDTWVAIARLVKDVTAPEPKEKRTITQLHGGSQAALICKKPAFWRFLQEERDTWCSSEEEAAAYVRHFCEVKSRSEIETNAKARNRWHLLYSAFSAWLAEPVA